MLYNNNFINNNNNYYYYYYYYYHCHCKNYDRGNKMLKNTFRKPVWVTNITLELF